MATICLKSAAGRGARRSRRGQAVQPKAIMCPKKNGRQRNAVHSLHQQRIPSLKFALYRVGDKEEGQIALFMELWSVLACSPVIYGSG